MTTIWFRYWRSARRFHERASGVASFQDINIAWFARAAKSEPVLTAAEVTFILRSDQFWSVFVPHRGDDFDDFEFPSAVNHHGPTLMNYAAIDYLRPITVR